MKVVRAINVIEGASNSFVIIVGEDAIATDRIYDGIKLEES